MNEIVKPASRGGSSGSLYDVVELILDRGLVIDVFARVKLVGIEVLSIDARIVVGSVDAYLRFAEACGRLDLGAGSLALGLPGLVGQIPDAPTRSEMVAARRKEA